ncbi:MAG: hypothetical protein J6S67_15715 [Methanobrevibacter sp.]|nr:hypothetical protein [Methanobrevibacter sp.]
MIKIEGTADELKRLKDALNLKHLCPFGVRENIVECLKIRDCELCINTNIQWVEKNSIA